jgi:hypothetical protein
MRMMWAIRKMMTPTRSRPAEDSSKGVRADQTRQFFKVKPLQRKRRDPNHVFIHGRYYSWRMLFLSAFAHLIPREPEANDLLAESHAALGHVGLTVIAIVFVLVTFWKS